MAKKIADTVMDQALNYIKTNCNKMTFLSAEPANYAAANSGALVLAEVAMASGDFTLAAGSPNGRKVTIAAKSSIPITADGTLTHIALVNTATSELLGHTTTTSQPLSVGGGGNTINSPAFDYTINQVT